MSNLLEITGEDIALLNDADLRTLIGLLCEADFRLAGLSTSGIVWGGHQDASDDGLDVIIRSTVGPPKNSLVPRRITGFQVKKPDMTPARIKKEMKPKGKLREEIKKLIKEHGAYIIANSAGSVTEKALHNRLDAMREVVSNTPNHQRLFLDFLDRGRIASWVRTHSSLILWVRNKISRPLHGWQPYGNWTNSPNGLYAEYIVGEESRLYDGSNSERGDSIVDGLNKLRLRLSQNGASIRLTGLSGVGKTRFVQALFDERVGENALDQSLAHYADISDSPVPDPVSFATQLVEIKAKAILIIDNCSLELHRKLTKSCAGSTVSLLTVEYDIRDDVPEETEVFRLEPSSDILIENLLEKRFPSISQINARTIAEFASGNARVAIALANTLKQGESLSTLRDEELFDRLFHQRHLPSEGLRISAEVCSLVYSFEADDITSEKSELKFLASLVEKTSHELYRDVSELRNRGIIQVRNIWRAVLPHAIANRLAKNALKSIPIQTIVNAFLSSGSERLIKSFSRRLGYLHDFEPAIEITKTWLKPDGWLGETNCNFNSLGLAVFENIAPLVPEATLMILERAANERGGLERIKGHEFVRLLRHLAYEDELFPRSVKLLSRLALLEKNDTNDSSSARATLKALNHIALSGTHASAKTRASIIDQLIESDVEEEQDLGLNLLDAALQTDHFWTSHTTSFGARPRDYGYHPKSNEEIVGWYRIYSAICTKTILLDVPVSKKARRILANHLRGLWSIGASFSQEFLDELGDSIIRIHSQKTWNEGWISLNGIVRYDGEKMGNKSLERLRQLSQRLKPEDLLEKARTYALTDEYLHFDLDDDFSEGENATEKWKQIQDSTRQIGAAVGRDEVVFKRLLPELVSFHHHRLFVFGEGLAYGSEDRSLVWEAIYKQIENTLPEKRQITFILGFLSFCAENDTGLYDVILDSLINDELLGRWFPYFQLTSKINKQSIDRLHKSLDDGNADIYSYLRLNGAWANRDESVNDDDLAMLIQKIILRDNGIRVASEILGMRFHEEKKSIIAFSQKLIEVSRDVLLQYPYYKDQRLADHPDYWLEKIVDMTMQGIEGEKSAKELCQLLVQGFQEHRIYSFHYPKLLRRMAEIQPIIFLDIFLGKDEYMFKRMTLGDLEREGSPVNQISEDVLIDWCEKAPETRYPLLVSSIQLYSIQKDSGKLYWHPLIFTIFEKSPNLQFVLLYLEREIYPMSWSGSLADAMAKRFSLFAQLLEYPNREVVDWAMKQSHKLEVEVEKQREREIKENQDRFESFE